MKAKFKTSGASRADEAPCVALIHEGVNEIVQEGVAIGHGLDFQVRQDDAVVFAQADTGEMIGVICYRRVCGQAHVSLVYVEPSSRRQGVFTAMWQELRLRLSTSGMSEVRLAFHVQNTAAVAVASKLRLEPLSVTHSLRVPQRQA